jgi:hypothetical protein
VAEEERPVTEEERPLTEEERPVTEEERPVSEAVDWGRCTMTLVRVGLPPP